MSKYDDMLHEYDELSRRDALDFSIALSGMQEMFLDDQRVADLYLNADKAILDIDAQFQKATGLNHRDVAFLMLATALQIGRWVTIALVNRAVSEKIADNRVEHNDDSIKQMEKDKRNQYKEKHKDWDSKKGSGKYRGWQNLAFESVPYDITRGSSQFGIDGEKLLPDSIARRISMEGGYHRYHTLGHDPLLGWIFGTMNIISDTITLDKTYALQTFRVEMITPPRKWTGRTTALQAFKDTIESLNEDIRRLPAAVFAQALHLKSDEFTKLGLPVPLLEAFAPNFESKIYKEGYDSLLLMKDIARIGIQTVSSILINLLIASIHDLFYDQKIYPNHDLYEVKTRKILSISNAISTSSNLIWVGGNAWLGNEDAWKDLDIGGLIVTMYRLVTDVKFISRVEKEFLESEWCRTVVGDEYKFIQEVAAMSRKDIEKGIEIQAKADAAHERKLADGLEKHAAILQNIEDRQKSVRSTMSTVLQDMKAMEAKVLYGIDPGRTPRDLGDNEKKALCAALYSLMEATENLTNNQRTFFLNFEKYLGITNRVEGFNYSKLSNIDRNSDRILVLEVICSFLFLENEDFSFLDDKKYTWLRDFAVRKDMDYVCENIRKEYSIVGVDGIVDKYIIAETITEEITPAIEEEASPDIVIEANEDTEPYSALEKMIKAYVADETAFGKCVNSSPQAAIKEIRAAYPRLDLGTIISISRVGNGYLFFSTCALYLKSGSSSKDQYIRIPYSSVIANKISMGLGRAKGTRKLMVTYTNESGEVTATIDDTKIQEEKLRDLLKVILSPDYPFADNDMSLNLPELDAKEQELYFKALGNILHRGGYGMAEMYLIMDDYSLSERWNEISADFSDDEELESNIRKFLKNVPYPSNHSIPQQAVVLALQTICRTNILEGRDVSMITDETERLVRLFDNGKLSDKAFNDMLAVVANNPRPLDPNVIFYLTQRLDPSTSYYESIKSGADAMEKALEQKLAKKNPVQELLKDVARFVPDTDDIKQGANKVLGGLKFPSKKETLSVPKDYKQIRKKIPDGVGIPKGALQYAKRTENAYCNLVGFPVTEQETMPFDNPQFVIDSLHKEMGEKEGIIEVKNGETAAGRPYIYNIIKHLDVGPNGEPMKMNYIMNLNVRMDNSIQFFNGCFSEEGITGMRDSIGMAIFHKVREQDGIETTEDNIMDGWFRDPYDENYTRGLPKNFSEAEELDEKFPTHPLSEARAFVRFIIENN